MQGAVLCWLADWNVKCCQKNSFIRYCRAAVRVMPGQIVTGSNKCQCILYPMWSFRWVVHGIGTNLLRYTVSVSCRKLCSVDFWVVTVKHRNNVCCWCQQSLLKNILTKTCSYATGLWESTESPRNRREKGQIAISTICLPLCLSQMSSRQPKYHLKDRTQQWVFWGKDYRQTNGLVSWEV